MANFFLRKSRHWNYEKEYRSIRMDMPDADMAAHLFTKWEGDVAIADPRIVHSVTLGAKMPIEHRQILLAWIAANANHAEVWQASLHRSRFEVVRERIA